MTDPCNGSVPGGRGCTCDPPWLPLDLDKIAARADAATQHTWYVEGRLDGGWRIHSRDQDEPPDFTEIGKVRENFVASGMWRADAEFIAAAREDIPQLVAALRVARHQLDAVREVEQRLQRGTTVGVIRQTLADDLFAALSSVPDPQE